MALRELALRRTADRVEDDVQTYRSDRSIDRVWKTESAILCCIGPGAGAEHIVRSAALLAQQLAVSWHAVVCRNARTAAAAGAASPANPRERQARPGARRADRHPAEQRRGRGRDRSCPRAQPLQARHGPQPRELLAACGHARSAAGRPRRGRRPDRDRRSRREQGQGDVTGQRRDVVALAKAGAGRLCRRAARLLPADGDRPAARERARPGQHRDALPAGGDRGRAAVRACSCGPLRAGQRPGIRLLPGSAASSPSRSPTSNTSSPSR